MLLALLLAHLGVSMYCWRLRRLGFFFLLYVYSIVFLFYCRDAYSLENSDGFTRHNFNAIVDNATLADTYWPAFKATVQEGKALGVMCSCKFAITFVLWTFCHASWLVM